MKMAQHRLLPTILGLTLGSVLWVAPSTDAASQQAPQMAKLVDKPTESPAPVVNSPILPLPLAVQLDPAKVALGNKLFHDPRLSANDKISCASCHDINSNGADNKPVSIGIGGAKTGVNSPTVFNSGLNFMQFWDGRADSLEQQVDGPVHHPGEMGSNWRQILPKLRSDAAYTQNFKNLYKDGLTVANIKDAIAIFERSLITVNSRFDRYLRGERNALTRVEQSGYRMFSDLGCVSCHQGQAVGGNMFQKFGVIGDYFKDRGNITQADYGRYNVTGDNADKHVFKVPSLRNVELTAPYFHDGSATTLTDAVRVMGKYQLGRPLKEFEVTGLVAFLKTLTGEVRSTKR